MNCCRNHQEQSRGTDALVTARNMVQELLSQFPNAEIKEDHLTAIRAQLNRAQDAQFIVKRSRPCYHAGKVSGQPRSAKGAS